MINFIITSILLVIITFILIRFLLQLKNFNSRKKKINEWWKYSFLYIEESKRLDSSKHSEFLDWHIKTFILSSPDEVVRSHKNLQNIKLYFDINFRPYLK